MRYVLGIALAGVVSAPAAAQDKMTYGTLADPAFAAATWAIIHGKVKSDKLTIDVKPVSIPAMIQALSTKQYDAVAAAVPTIPVAISRGIPVVILSTALRLRSEGVSGDLWVKADSPIKTAADLKGKTIGVYGVQSTGIMLARYVLTKKYGLNTALEGGDVKLAELPPPTIPGAVLAGRIDAGAFLHYQAYTATLGKDLRNIGAGQSDMNEVLGVPAVTAVTVSYADRLAAKPEMYKEFNRQLKASYDYMLANQAEVYGAVAKESNVPIGYFQVFFSKFAEFPQVVSDDDIKAYQRTWEISKEMKLFDKYPNAKDVVWEHALRK